MKEEWDSRGQRQAQQHTKDREMKRCCRLSHSSFISLYCVCCWACRCPRLSHSSFISVYCVCWACRCPRLSHSSFISDNLKNVEQKHSVKKVKTHGALNWLKRLFFHLISIIYLTYILWVVVVPGCLTPPSFLYILYVVELALVLNMHDLFVTGK
jgi:hypothetical protein